MRKLLAVLTAAALGALSAAIGAAPAAASPPPKGVCDSAPGAQAAITALPWAQQTLDLKRVWPRSTGAGVTVAVVDSGVDDDHPQLRGKVLPGKDFFLAGGHPATFDCASHGTAVASIIAAAPQPGVGFEGVAPDARILPVRVVDQAQSVDTGQEQQIDPNVIGQGIRFAADSGAKVINLSLSGFGPLPAVQSAIAYAQSRDVLVVASVGNRQQNAGQRAQSFPAAYPGVLGVGDVDISGQRDGQSQIGAYVDIMAPGKQVVGAARVAGHEFWTGTSFAAAFVSGTAALVRAAWPQLSAPQVADRLRATASASPGGAGSQEYGAGLVNPYRAVTEGLSGAPAALPPVPTPKVDPAAVADQQWWARAGLSAKLGVGAVLLLVALAVVVPFVLTRGRRSRWRPARVVPAPVPPAREEPPEQIFLFPKPGVEEPGR